jgi:hypothetical protein
MGGITLNMPVSEEQYEELKQRGKAKDEQS